MSAMDGRRKPTQEQIDAEQAKLEFQRRQEVADLKWLLAHAEGRRIATRILAQTHVYRPSFNTSGTQMSFNEGERNIGLWFTSELMDAAPDKFVQLFKEFQGK